MAIADEIIKNTYRTLMTVALTKAWKKLKGEKRMNFGQNLYT